MVTAAMKLKDAPWKESYDKPRQCIEKQRKHFADKGPYNQSYSFSSGLYPTELIGECSQHKNPKPKETAVERT